MHKKTTLSNGVRIVTKKLKERDSIALGFWIGVGGRYEKDRVKGAAHFLEHIVFKGTKKYNCEEIKEKIEGVGGSMNAFTSEEQTCFYAKIPTRFLEQTFDVLSDMVIAPKIAPADVRKERMVIVEEIKMYHDLPQYYVLELLDALVWPDHPLGKSLAGNAQTILKTSPADLKNFHQSFYAPNNIVISACGNVEHGRIERLVKAKWGGLKKKKAFDFEKASNSQVSPRMKFFKKDVEQMHICLGMLGYDENDSKKYSLTLLSTILGGNMSSRLFVELREKKGLAYSVCSSIKCLHDTGLFMIRAGVDANKAVDAISLILKELKRIRDQRVSVDEFKRAKDYLLGQLVLGLEDTMDNMLWMGEGVIATNEVRSLKRVVARFKKITREDIQAVAQDILNRAHYNLAVVGPITNKQQSEIKALFEL